MASQGQLCLYNALLNVIKDLCPSCKHCAAAHRLYVIWIVASGLRLPRCCSRWTSC